ncbi:MAG: hypothetical protein AMXMBFR82_31460 [Candidatus Hydrogenedentota bacterium]
MWSGITFDPPFPAPAILGLGVLLAALVVWSYVRAQGRAGRVWRTILAVFRLAAIAALIIVLLRPMRTEPSASSGRKPVFAVMVDSSASMKTADVDGMTRFDAVAGTVREHEGDLMARLNADYDVRFYLFDSELVPASIDTILNTPEPQGMATDLGEALQKLAGESASRPSAGALLVSDGRDNVKGEIRQAALMLKSQKVPVWTIPVGSDTQTKDLVVTARLNQNFLFVNQPAKLKVTLSQSGYADWYAEVNLLRDGEQIGSQQVMLKGSTETVDFPIQEDHKGVFRYAVEVTPLPEEADPANNNRTVFARVVDEKSRVLFVEAKPYWDSKFLLRALQRDPNLEVTSIFQVTADKIFGLSEKSTSDLNEKTEVAQGVFLPTTKEEWFEYDCIIFGKGIDALFTSEQLGLLREYLTDRGGSVVFARGRAYDAENEVLAALEPVDWGDDVVRQARIELTPEGEDSPLFAFGRTTPADFIIRELPEMVSITKVEDEKSLSVILARISETDQPGVELGSKVAAISYQRYGRGKVMSIGTTGLWRWAFMPPELEEYDDIYSRFWSQMIRWLIFESDFLPGQDISFRTNQYAYNLGERVLLTVRTQFVDSEEFNPRVTIEEPGGVETTVELPPSEGNPGAYQAYYQPSGEGEFRATMRSTVGESREASEWFTVYADSVESRFVAADPELLGQISSVTGGDVLAFEDLGSLPDRVREFERLSKEEAKPRDAWDTLGVFGILIGLLALEWFARRRTGLV